MAETPQESLDAARQAVRNLRALNPLEESDAAIDLADAFAQLDGHLTAGGALPTSWQPPLMMREQDGAFLTVQRAQRRLEDVLDRAIRDDERIDRTLVPAVLGRHAEPKFREYLVKLLAREIIRELEAEQRQVRAMVEQMLTDQMARSAEQAAQLLREPPAPIRVELDRHLTIRWSEPVDMPESLRRPNLRPLHCPNCDSPDPAMHPAVSGGGEAIPCPNPWHHRPS